MKVALIGAGAMGGLFGSLLFSGGVDVTLVDTWEDHVAVIQQQGLKVQWGETEKIVPITATTKITDVDSPDIIILFVKAYHTESAARDCRQIINKDTIILTLQNGVGNIEKIGAILGRERVIAGTTSFGCTVLKPGEIRPSNMGEITIGEIDGVVSDRLQRVQRLFQSAGIETHVSNNIDSLIWTKLLVNVGINALTAITAVTNGQLLDIPETTLLLERAVAEGVEVAQQKKISLSVEQPLRRVKEVAIETYHNKSSMLQDIERQARTEVDSINGAIVIEGEKFGIHTPVNEILTLLIKAMEHRTQLSH